MKEGIPLEGCNCPNCRAARRIDMLYRANRDIRPGDTARDFAIVSTCIVAAVLIFILLLVLFGTVPK